MVVGAVGLLSALSELLGTFPIPLPKGWRMRGRKLSILLVRG